jgi:Ulp1 family protease
MKLDRVVVATLEDGGWLNDSVIMAYLYQLIEGRPEWGVIDSLLLAKAESPSWAKAAERLRTRNVARLLLPIHDADHWRLVVVDRHGATNRCYDSLPNVEGVKKSLAFVRDVVLPQKARLDRNGMGD